MATLNESIVALHELRGRLAAANNQYKAKCDLFDIENKELREGAKGLALAVTLAETAIKQAAVLVYENDQSTKQIAPGIVIKEFTQIGYDRKKAFDWAVEHKMALVLDEKTFEKIAPSANLDWVLTVTTPKATIATDLFKAVLAIEEGANVPV